jgi:hypothetical protein
MVLKSNLFCKVDSTSNRTKIKVELLIRYVTKFPILEMNQKNRCIFPNLKNADVSKENVSFLFKLTISCGDDLKYIKF